MARISIETPEGGEEHIVLEHDGETLVRYLRHQHEGDRDEIVDTFTARLTEMGHDSIVKTVRDQLRKLL